MTEDQIEEWFTYHKPVSTELCRLEILRDAAKDFAKVLNKVCPGSADKTAAMRKLRECVMTANASIVLKGNG